MSLEIAEKNSLQRQINLLRVALVAMALLWSFQGVHRPGQEMPWKLLWVYLVAAIAIAVIEFATGRASLRINPWLDLAVAGACVVDLSYYGAASCLLFLCVYALVATGKGRQALAATLIAVLGAVGPAWMTIHILAPFGVGPKSLFSPWALAFAYLIGLSLPLSACAAWPLGRREHAHLGASPIGEQDHHRDQFRARSRRRCASDADGFGGRVRLRERLPDVSG